MPESSPPLENYELHDDNSPPPTQPPQPHSAETVQFLTYDKFCEWKYNPIGRTALPEWLNFYLIFCSDWQNVADKKGVWIRKIKEIAPGLFADITTRCDRFIRERTTLETVTTVNGDGISPNFTTSFLLEIQELMYRAYLIARCCVKSDYELFV